MSDVEHEISAWSLPSEHKEKGDTKPENNKTLLILENLNKAVLAAKEKGDDLAALEMMEQSLLLQQRHFGVNSIEVKEACKVTGSLCNKLAIQFLSQDEINMATTLLQKAEILNHNHKVGLSEFFIYFKLYKTSIFITTNRTYF